MSDEERKVKVVGRAREKENRRYRDGGSSEDVWEGRRVMVRGAFQGDFWAASEEHERLEREKEGGMGSGGKGGG